LGRGAVTDFTKLVKHEKQVLKSVESLHPAPPPDCTHYEFISAEGGVAVTGPVDTAGDFAKTKGTMRYGKLVNDSEWRKGKPEGFRYHPDYEPQSRRQAAAAEPGENLPGTEEASGTTKPKPARAPSAGGKREGVCGFIDATIMEGGRTVAQILEIVLAKFPGRDPKATESTIRCRPSHIKKRGEVPPAFVK
jgi:hypothetical protein